MSKVFELIELEKQRQITGLEMIPSENYVSENVLKALGSILTNKYSEGFPLRRYYGGNDYIDAIENYAIDLAKKLFCVEGVIVQPYSGSPANLAVCLALVKPGGTLMGLKLTSGGHLTHGADVSATGILFNSVQYGVGKDGKIDLMEVRNLAKKHKPKLIWVGTTAYPYIFDFEGFAKVADEVGAYLVADVSHIAGLIVGGVHPSPVPYVHVITTTTHKTLRGPRGAMILITKKGLEKDLDLSKKLEAAVFPGLQGGPHNHQTAAIAVSLEEASKPEFKDYAKQIVKNARVLAVELGAKTENHLMVLDLSSVGFGLGYQAQVVLEYAGITVNKNTIPHESVSPFYPSGVRIGTPALTSRGMKEDEMRQIAAWIKRALEVIKRHDLPKEQSQRREFIREFKKKMKDNLELKRIRKEIVNFTKDYPVPGIS